VSVTLPYAKAHDLSQLHDELLAAALVPERVEGLGDDLVLTMPDGTVEADVDAVVAAHVARAEVAARRRAGGRAAQRVRAAKAATVADLRAVLLAHLQAEEEAEA
jgi:hypothetical protein